MEDELLLRYSRQILLPEIDVAGQMQLIESSVLLLGLGGLGSVVSMYLAAAGVGNLILVDDDDVELSNLQRQIVHTTDRIGEKKVESAKRNLMALNPNTAITTIDRVLDEEGFNQVISDVDIIVDATDNFESRFFINRQSIKHVKPLVSGAATRLEGQISVFNSTADSPCYECLYSRGTSEQSESCSESGVVAPLLGIIGSIQAMEVLKLIVGFGESLEGRLLLLDSSSMEWHSVSLSKDPQCNACSRSKTHPI